MTRIFELANGHWPAILGALAGLSSEQLTDKHQPCPLCAGKDRYRFDDQDGTGSWFCNQCGGPSETGGGGSGIELLMRRTGWTFREAAQRVEQHLGVTPQRPEPPTKGAEHVWRYSDTFLVCRFPAKKIRPLWWSGSRWEWKAPPAPRPLLNLSRIRSDPGTVLIVEGEKAADAAAKLYLKAVVTTWPSGCKAIEKADWSPLKGRRVILWPDADQVGQQAMDRLAQLLLRLPVDRVQMVTPPAEVPEGWDLADATWTTDEALACLKANLSQPLELDATPEPEPAQPELAEADPEPIISTGPFKALGYDHGVYFYLPANTCQVIALTAAQHSKAHFLQLAPLDWWKTTFRDDKDRIDWDAATDTIMRLCEDQKVYDPSRVRGRGAWTDASRVVLHLGNRLVVDGRSSTITKLPASFDSFYTYENAKAILGPSADPLTDDIAGKIRSIALRFRWETPASANMLLGWIVLAPVCGALEWRPHIWITGGAGTGKTTILKSFIKPLLGGMYEGATGGTTEAGLRGQLRSDAIPIVFDELEQNEQKDKQQVQNILSLARIASSEGGKIYKGTTSGGVNTFEVRSMFCVSSINVALVQRADLDRFCVLSLKRDHMDKNDWEAFEQDILDTCTEDNGRKLVARTISQIPLIRKNAKILAAALARKFGQRFGDQYGTLLAGAWSLQPDGGGDLTVEAARQWVENMDWDSREVDATDADEAKCLARILQSLIQVDSGKRLTILELVQMAAETAFSDSPSQMGMSADEVANVLGRYGLKVTGGALAVSNSSTNLQALLRDTPWSGTAYRQALRRIDGATHSNGTVRFAGSGVSRATLVPLHAAGVL
jgi:putative DNA primase/helicase